MWDNKKNTVDTLQIIQIFSFFKLNFTKNKLLLCDSLKAFRK